jgi:hypothetical protein
MRPVLFLCVALVAGLSLASGYDATQQAMIDGTSLSWKMAVAYTNQDTTTFNALAGQWNTWVRQHFGEDQNLLMNLLTGPVDLSKPVLTGNNTTAGIVHAIDGNRAGNKTYTTNDLNLLPASSAEKRAAMIGTYPDGSSIGGQYLGGV